MNITFIVGCARSGTSILGEYIAAHPGVEYQFESNRIWNSIPPMINESHYLDSSVLTPELAKQVRSYFAQFLEGKSDKILVEKNPRNSLRIGFLAAAIPEAKFIHIIRDGRDVACSLKPGLSDGWNHLKPPTWMALAKLPLIERCAYLWRDVVAIALQSLSTVKHLQVRYDSLLLNTESEGERICTFLGIPFASEMKAFAEKIQDNTENSYHAKRQDNWFRPDHNKRIGRWQENLTTEEQQKVTSIQKTLLKMLFQDLL